MMAVLIQCTVTVQPIDYKSARVQPVQDGVCIGWECMCVQDYLIQLCHLLEKVLGTRTLERAPPPATSPVGMHQ